MSYFSNAPPAWPDMNKESARLLDQLDRAFDGAAWHGDPVFDVLGRISADRACARPIDGARSIADVVLHIEVWLTAVRRRTAGEDIGLIEGALDWPVAPSGTPEESWDATLAILREGYEQLRAHIASLKDSDLDREVAGQLRPYTVYEDLHGVIQHSLYHLGQIVMLAKAAATGPTP